MAYTAHPDAIQKHQELMKRRIRPPASNGPIQAIDRPKRRRVLAVGGTHCVLAHARSHLTWERVDVVHYLPFQTAPLGDLVEGRRAWPQRQRAVPHLLRAMYMP